ncbi:dTDP-glucose 4,6-dehydratase [Desulfobaculum xiamenense]|uniref:dTDP-glucose 4,6-dehydratase n=1 Tax=Desulfobaculum xiamenense TaxID=995050 RepID=A0A846QSC8_9BACT|nr:dTDP-glucose 4,6-dehydratase [Desulfobaculum xiamenense]NJB69442.1 dTDP-glucose 4,6-dehydratase [Desulfobaculum xiamenense]
MKILVTGGCGFIGTNFIYYMLGTYPDVEIVNLDKLTYAGNRANMAPLEQSPMGTRHTFVRADIADPVAVRAILADHKPDAVVNFAAESHVDRSIHDPAPFVTTNVMGVQTLLTAAMEANIERFVHISTDEVYGSLTPEDPAFTEDNHLRPNSPYSASKASADLFVRAFWKTYGFPAVVTRCSNNYGPWQFPEKLIPLMIKLAEEGQPLPIYGDGMQVRDWIFVTDHCRGVDMALRNGRPGAIYNFGGNAEKPNIDVVHSILAAMGRPETLVTHVKDRPGHDRRYAMNYSLAHRELGFEPLYDFERGLRETLDWYAANREWRDKVASGEYRTFMDAWYGERK